MKTNGNILDVVRAKNTNRNFARVLRNAAANEARRLASPANVIGIPAMLKKQAF